MAKPEGAPGAWLHIDASPQLRCSSGRRNAIDQSWLAASFPFDPLAWILSGQEIGSMDGFMELVTWDCIMWRSDGSQTI